MMQDPNLPSGKDFITFREAVAMFVSKADFQAFATEIKSKIDSTAAKVDQIKDNQIPRWVWVVLATIIGPVIAALLIHLLTKVWP